MRSLISILVLLFISTGTAVAAGPTVSVSPQQSVVAVGGTASVNIVLQNFPVSEGGGVSLQFDPAVVKVTGVSVNSTQWDFASSPGTIDNDKGKVSDIWFSSFKGLSGTATVATIQLQAVKGGKCPLKISESSLNPFASGGQIVAVQFVNGLVQVKGRK